MNWKIAIFNPGDHIRVKRDHYYHHGVYVGNGEVIHFTGERDDSINIASEVLVRKTPISFFLKDGVGEKAIYSKKEKRQLRSCEEIVRVATQSLGEGKYDIVSNNCEDFANRVCFKNLKKAYHRFNIFRFLARLFLKVTGFIPYLILVTPRMFFESHKAKKDSKNIKDGAIIISNHTSIYDYYFFLYRYIGRVVHTMVAEVVYKYKSLAHLCTLLENIKIDRNESSNIKGYKEARNYLISGKTVLIFPEGKLEDNVGTIEEIKPSAILLAFETGKPIIPYYVKGNYGLFKRAKYIVGEKIDVRSIIKKDKLEIEDIKYMQEYIANVFKSLKRKLHAIETVKTQALVSKKTYVQDFIKITSFPIGYCILRAKKIYLGNKKEIKKIMRDKVLIAPNHTSMIDVVFMYLYFFSRRIRILSLSTIWTVKPLEFALKRAGAIKYNRDSPNGFDMQSFKETTTVLDGNGAVVIFPQGHISKDGIIDEELKPGLAIHSLKHKAPIIPVIFADETVFWKLNRIVIGDPIYPDKYLENNAKVNNEMIAEYNKEITEKMLDLQAKSVKYSRKAKKED